MAEPLAESADVADIWRPLSTAETERAAKLIAKASALLRAASPFDIDERIALQPTDPRALDAALVATVVAGMVKRVMVNPEGAASTSETIGPFSKSSTFAGRDSGEPRGGLVVLASDIDALRPAPGFVAPSTIRTRPRLTGEGCP